MYIAKYLRRRYGIEPHIIAPYGRDFLPYADNFELVVQPGERGTLAYESIVNDGKRVQYGHNLQAAMPPALNERARYLLSRADCLIVAPLVDNYATAYVRELASLAPAGCLKVLIPQGYMRRHDETGRVHRQQFAQATELMPLFDVLVMSDEDCDDPLQAAAQWSGCQPDASVVITQAERGATLFWRGRRIHVTTTPIAFDRIRNPVGSGDLFAAELARSLQAGLDPVEAVRAANRATGEMLVAAKPLS